MNLQTMVFAWLIFGTILGALEIVVPGAVLGFLGLAAFLVAGLVHFEYIDNIVHALVAWFATSLVFVIFLRSFVVRILPGETSVENTDEDKDAYGSVVEVCEEIRPYEVGRIRFRDTTWEAESEFALEVGQKALIISRRGQRWIVKPL